MHPHLYTKDNGACEEVMKALDDCHARGFLWRSIGGCNGEKTQVNKCLRAQRLKRTEINREKAKVERAKIKALFADIDANS
ncbi:hypothetical protein H2201_000690 [Coniosporium apollinis]|uniref:COX assembly mitochondrial protein n=2 Tax=Coniosporium TaxID=2810619 RepID=A0ABQ9P8Y4_9PEZI|nr:hypothetical protein H2199_002653 [Cladosporium sp. JES 115]KAJ9669338.1 hypothetical protein H2201_000690 [Coniosporium apollinis]